MKRSNILIVLGILVGGWLVMLLVSPMLYGPSLVRWVNSRVAGRLGAGSLRQTDEQGNVWQLDIARRPRRVSTDPNSPQPGPPVIVKTDVQRAAGQVLIGLVLDGQAGEGYRVIRKNGRMIAAPKLKIVNEAGQEIANGRFAYG